MVMRAEGKSSGELVAAPSPDEAGAAGPPRVSGEVAIDVESSPPRRDSLAPPTRGSAPPIFAPFDPRDLIGVMVGSYRIERVIGNGGVGCVYAARHPTIGSSVAVKVLHPHVATSPDAHARFLREARASAEIGGAFIPRYFDFGELSDGRAYAVMELLSGETIDERIERRGKLSLEETTRWLIQIAQVLGEAHARGIIHRDIKPDNLFIARDSQGEESIRVLDFGIAMTVSDGDKRLTQSGVFVGTPVYCPPEQMFGQAVTASADIYALAATGYQMLTGVVPFDGHMGDLFDAKTRHEPPSIRKHRDDLPRVVDATLRRALSRRPEKRFATTAEFERAVASWLTASRSKPRWRPSGRLAMGALALATLSFCLVMLVRAAFSGDSWGGELRSDVVQLAPALPAAMAREPSGTVPTGTLIQALVAGGNVRSDDGAIPPWVEPGAGPDRTAPDSALTGRGGPTESDLFPIDESVRHAHSDSAPLESASDRARSERASSSPTQASREIAATRRSRSRAARHQTPAHQRTRPMSSTTNSHAGAGPIIADPFLD